jgi:hypothetical protein
MLLKKLAGGALEMLINECLAPATSMNLALRLLH